MMHNLWVEVNDDNNKGIVNRNSIYLRERNYDRLQSRNTRFIV